MLIHGFGEASCVWNHLAARLMSGSHVAAMDLRGHGNSDWDPEHRYNIETFTADLNSVVASLGFERLILVGHSFGAEMAIHFAASNPLSVAALVIVDFGPELSKLGVDQVRTGFVDTPRSFASWEGYAQWLMERRPLADARQLEQFARHSLRQLPSAAWQPKADPALADSSIINRPAFDCDRYRDPELWETLKRVKCPTLVVRGAASGVFPQDVASRMVELALSGGRLATINRAGHAVMLDNPVDFSNTVAGFVSAHSRDNGRKTIYRKDTTL